MDTCADILIVIDLQNGVCYSEEHLFDLQNLLTKVNKRISSYRKSNKPILFVQHCDNMLSLSGLFLPSFSHVASFLRDSSVNQIPQT